MWLVVLKRIIDFLRWILRLRSREAAVKEDKGVAVVGRQSPFKAIKTSAEEVVRRGRQFPFKTLGGLNMPRYQPCPQCHAGSKRDRTATGGAYYNCKRCHLSFFVKGPGGYW